MDALSKNLTYFGRLLCCTHWHRWLTRQMQQTGIKMFFSSINRISKPCRHFKMLSIPAPEKNLHPWQQPENDLRNSWISSQSGDLVLILLWFRNHCISVPENGEKVHHDWYWSKCVQVTREGSWNRKLTKLMEKKKWVEVSPPNREKNQRFDVTLIQWY